MGSKANVEGNIWEVHIDQNDSPFAASIAYKPVLDIAPVNAAIAGTTPIGHIVQGHGGTLDFEWAEWEIEGLKRALGVTEAGVNGVFQLPTIGRMMPTHHIRLHNPAAAGNSTDLVFLQVVFNGIDRTMNGQGNAVWKSTAMLEQDASGKTFELGWVDPSP